MIGRLTALTGIFLAAVLPQHAQGFLSAPSPVAWRAGTAVGVARPGSGVPQQAVKGLASWDPSNIGATAMTGSPTPWITPAVHNRNSVRATVLVATVAFLARGSNIFAPGVGAIPKFIYASSLGIWFGTSIWTTFVAGITMFKNLPRQTFGRLQSKLFPAYFLLNTISTLAMVGSMQQPLIALKTTAAGRMLALGLVCNVLNLLYVEPASTKIMFRRYELENDNKKDTDEYKKLAASFGKFHGISSLVNLGALVAAFGCVWHMALSLPVM
jgi:hypothetical protein